jgi:hypothetical protein
MSKLMQGIALVVILALAAGGAVASAEIFESGNLIVKADGKFKPKKLPKKKRKPIKLTLKGAIRTKDGSTPPVAQKVVIDFDKNGGIYTKGKKKCRPNKLIDRRTKAAVKACRKSLIGTGRTKAVIDFPDQDPFVAVGPLRAFMGKRIHGNPSVIIHVFANVPAPTAFVVPVQIRRKAPGRKYGIRTITKVPTISGGNGSLSFFKVKFNKKWRHKGKTRRFATARCKNGRFVARTKVNFQGGQRIRGGLVRRCKKKRR